jgi:hypothetical protein
MNLSLFYLFSYGDELEIFVADKVQPDRSARVLCGNFFDCAGRFMAHGRVDWSGVTPMTTAEATQAARRILSMAKGGRV